MCELTEWVAAPYLRRTVTIAKAVEKAELSVCGLGFYRFWLDGTELTRGHMSPFISNPDDIMDYDVYDITDRIGIGRHALGFLLGNGMQNCFGGYVWDFEKGAWRSAPKLAVCLALTYADGTAEEIEADEAFVWMPSPILFDDIRHGERYDAALEIPGWNLPDFDDSAWNTAVRVECPRGRSVVCGAKPIREWNRLTPIAIKPDMRLTYTLNPQIDEGYLYDFGTDYSGIPLLRIKGQKGQKISMIFGEYIDSKGNFTVDNLRFVREDYSNIPLYIQRDEYTCKGEGIEEWSPSFTYHGFRYCLVTGITAEQATEDLLTYIVMNTELEERGAFSCSDAILNQLQSMVRVATLANFYHFPTDCPHREKNGWTADASLSLEHTLLNLAPDANYREWYMHILASQDERGNIPVIVPTGGWGGHGINPSWDILLFHLPYMFYRYRGDKQIVEDSLAGMWHYLDFLVKNTNEDGLVPYGLGDWCAPTYYEGFVERSFTSTVAAIEMCRQASVLFDLCGRTTQADFCRALGSNYREAIRAHLIDYDRMIVTAFTNGKPCSQTAQAMAIYYGIFNDDEIPAAYKRMTDEIHREGDHLDVGVLGARVIFHLLTERGDAELAYAMIANPTYPSYGALAAAGNTAMTECFELEDDRINSRNHHFFGDVSAWFIKCICGIHYNPDITDHARVDIKPHFLNALSHAEAYHECPMGKIEVRWARNDDGTVSLTVAVPASMHGNIVFPDGWVCASCGKTETDAVSGSYTLKAI